MLKKWTSITNSGLGNILEWYDFGLFSIFSPLFSRLFFPQENSQTALLATISIFSIGFFCRPLGALLFGYYGDRYGRAKTLRFSMLMIFLPTFLIGCLPTYQQIGIFAPLGLLIIRMWQGISIGGEYSGNIIYLAETAPKYLRATITSFASLGANIGILLASVIGSLISLLMHTANLENWGWRLPYLISGAICLLIYFFRLRIKETSTYNLLQKQKLVVKNPIKTAFKNNFKEILQTIGLVCMGTTFYYFCFIYIPIYLNSHLQIPISVVSTLVSACIMLMILVIPLAGYICDQAGHRRMLLLNAIMISGIILPGFYFLQFNIFFVLVAVLSIFTLASSFEQGTTPIVLVENFPPETRYTGLSFGYNLGNGVLGGTTPMICEWLLRYTGFYFSPAIYITMCALVTLSVVWVFMMPKRKTVDLKLSRHCEE